MKGLLYPDLLADFFWKENIWKEHDQLVIQVSYISRTYDQAGRYARFRQLVREMNKQLDHADAFI